ncbi:MAG: hypothetical protein JJ850_00180 [Kordiimonadaceae bacterium]|nr:hypothetical protein [Kordiimonadaceae bacterium]MBO6567785.1 hypothetical protein [Kordiimonadaceae bacterium]MBO6963000.1 hypothetical protein [Kordiimonadaceae bacterium]
MKIIHVVFVLLLAIAGITVFVWTSEVPNAATGIPHPEVAGLSLGGSGTDKLSAIGDAPYYFQILVILLAGSLLYMGVPAQRRDTLLKVVFAVGLLFALFVWAMLWGGYQSYLTTGETTVVFGFPAPTNWMFWGIWGSFVAFDLFYVFAFRRYFLHPDDEAAFEALVREMKTEENA